MVGKICAKHASQDRPENLNGLTHHIDGQNLLHCLQQLQHVNDCLNLACGPWYLLLACTDPVALQVKSCSQYHIDSAASHSTSIRQYTGWVLKHTVEA